MAPDGTRAGLFELVSRFAELPVLVVGDPVLDVYVYGTTRRISREAPVPIVREDEREFRLGGAANAANNLAAQGARASLVGLAGSDEHGATMASICTRQGIERSGLLLREGRVTVAKTRILAGGVHTTKQQMLRLDREDDRPIEEADRAWLLASASDQLPDVEVIIISDYGQGALVPTYLEIARRARAAGKSVVVDSRFHLAAYRGVSCVTPNEPEAHAAFGADASAEEIRRALGTEAVVLTRGNQGMIVADAHGVTAIPRHGSPEAVDVTGAGDTVTATLSLSLAAGASIGQAAVIANCAASVVVQSIGAATCSIEALLKELSYADLSPLEAR